jgi:hypothetical protein
MKIVTRQVRKQPAQYIEIVSEREKTLARLASGFAYLLANPKFYLHLASWRVVIRTPGQAGREVRGHWFESQQWQWISLSF